MVNNAPKNTKFAQSKTAPLLWQIARCITGVLLILAGFTASIRAIIGIATATSVADGGASNGGYAFLFVGMVLAAAMGLLPTAWWTFSTSAENQWCLFSSFLTAGLSLISCALSHGSVGASWSPCKLDSVIECAAAATIALTLLGRKVVQCQKANSKLTANAKLTAFSNLTKLPPPHHLSVWELPRW